MQRAARTPLEAKFVANIHTVLPILLGEPDQDDGREFVYHDAVGKVAITYSREDPSSTGVFVRRHDNLGGAGFDLLELFELTEDDVAQVLADIEDGETPEPRAQESTEAKSAPAFQQILATQRDDDGRIERYLAGRGLPGMASHVRLVTMKGGRIGMAALAVDPVIGDAVALQVLQLDSIGRPAMVDGKKVRRTYTSIKGWTRDAAFTLAALEGGPAEVVMCEGTEDALSVRAVGWTGPVVATLGKGNIARHSPPGTTVILLFDGDVAEHEIDDALEAHKRANRTVRIARLPADTDPNDMLQAGRGAELLGLLTGAEAKESTVVEIEKALLRFPFDADGHARYMAARRELAKKFKLTQAYLDQVRKRLAIAAHPELEDMVGKEIITDIEPAAHPVDGEEIFGKLMAEFTSLVVFDRDDGKQPAGAVASSLWVMSTHCYERFPDRGDPLDDVFDHATRLMISAGTIRSGKTRLLDTIACLGRRVLRASSLSAAVLFRACERFRPLVLLDEVDHARLHEDGNALTQLVNDGFEPGGAAWRVGGEKNERLDCFRVFTPVALCGIGRLPSATEDRCVRIVLVRKPKSRKTARLNKSKKKALRALAPEILRWIQDSRKVLVQNLEPDFPPGVENDRDEDLWRPLLAIADTIGGEVPALARRAMLELIAAGHEQSVGEELMTAVHALMQEELVDHPKNRQIALPRLVGLVNSVDGSWSEQRGGLGCDSRWLGKQLKSFSLTTKSVRDPIHNESVAKGYDVYELLAVSRRYRADAEDDADTAQSSPGNRSTSSTSSTNTVNPSDEKGKTGDENVDDGAGVTGARSSTTSSARKVKINPITGKARRRSVDDIAPVTATSSSTKSSSANGSKPLNKSTTYGTPKSRVDDVDGVAAVFEGGRDTSGFYSDPIPGVDEPLPIDLTQLDPADLLPGEMKFYGYSTGSAPTFKVILPPGMPDDDPDAYARACRLANEHRAAVWRRLQAKRGG